MITALAAIAFSALVPPQAAAQVITFTSNGSYDVPPGVSKINVELAGGGGGGGGTDRSAGGSGGLAARVGATLRVTPGDHLVISVGKGGGAGSEAYCGGGGYGGPGWRSGGPGGRAGCTKTSGGGGGGGGASAITLNATVLSMAGGGGGGGGGGWSTTGLPGQSATDQTVGGIAFTSGLNGEPGGILSGNADGGGGGGGGAGCNVGRAGDAHKDNEAPTRAAGAGTSCVQGGYDPGSLFFGLIGGSAGYGGASGSAGNGGDGFVKIEPRPSAPSANHSSVLVLNDGQTANGSDADKLQATIKDSSNAPVAGATVSFAATAGVNFGTGGTGNPGTCTTDAGGVCSVDATSTSAAAYATQASLGATAIGSPLGYHFVAGPASAGRSALRIITNNALADGVQTDELEVLIRDAFDNPVGTTVVSIASPGSDVAFDGASAGNAGHCTTTASGACTIFATSSAAGGGSKTSAVTLAGTALAGSFTAGGFTYGPSPAVFRFAPWVPRVQVVKQVSGGTGRHTFVSNFTGLQSSADSITVNGPGSADGAQVLGRVGGGPISITEATSSDWPEAPVSASCVDLASANPGEPFGTLLGGQLLIPAGRSPAGANLRCTFVNARGPVVAGQVFVDTGIGGGTANDGLVNGAEPGLAGMAVTLGDCGATIHASTHSDGNGHYRLPVPPGLAAGSSLCVELPRPVANRIGTAGSIGSTPLPAGSPVAMSGISFTYSRETAADRIAFLWTGTGTVGLNFGSVPASSLVQAGTRTGRPGNQAHYGHIFTAGTAGSVSFSVPDSAATPAADGWSERVFADPACTGSLQPGAAVLYPPAMPQTLAAGQSWCVVLEQSIPVQAEPGNSKQTRLRADFHLANSAPPLSVRYELEDLTTVASEGVALLKEVRNVSQGVTSFGLANQARPGETLEYRISYSNQTPVPVNHLVISDNTPTYSSFVSASADTTPAALGQCRKLTPASTKPVDCTDPLAAGGKGAVSWTFDGPLQPGASGTVSFRVRLD